MRVYITQFYVEAGANFPFSYLMQRWLSGELSSLAKSSTAFAKKYGTEFELGIYISAYTQTTDNQIKGPTIFKKTKEVEYSIFLPYDVIIQTKGGCRGALEHLLTGIRHVFVLVGIDPMMLDERRDSIITHICSDPTMLEEPWPGLEVSSSLH